MLYTSMLGKKMLKASKCKVNIVEKGWYGLLQPNFKLRWTII
jgi:hypothetical protein